MKKTSVIGSLLFIIAMIFFGCASKPEAEKKAAEKPVYNANNEQNVDVAPVKQTIIDWEGKTIGIKDPYPTWLLLMTKGNGEAYCRAFGKTDSLDRKFIMPSAAENVNLNNALNQAQVETAYALGQEMATTINATMGEDLNDGQLNQVRTICINTNTTVAGLRFEGTFWQRIIEDDPYGNKRDFYRAYAFYSVDRSYYNELLNTYLIDVLKSKDLDRESVNKIASKAEQILKDAQEDSERREREKERELKRTLAEYDKEIALSADQTRQVEANARTEQVQARANSNARRSEAASSAVSNSAAATGSLMNPMLVDVIRNSVY